MQTDANTVDLRGLRADEAIEKLGPVDDPLIGVCVHWFYGPHTTDGVVGKDNPLLLASNFSGAWPGLVGLLNTGDSEARIRIHLFDAAGNEISTPSRILAHGQRLQLQEPFSQLAGRNDIVGGYAVVEVLDGEGVVVYASVIDNLSGDPVYVPAAR